MFQLQSQPNKAYQKNTWTWTVRRHQPDTMCLGSPTHTWGHVIPRCHMKPRVRVKRSWVIHTRAHLTLTTSMRPIQMIAPEARCCQPRPYFWWLLHPIWFKYLGFLHWPSNAAEMSFNQNRKSNCFLLDTPRFLPVQICLSFIKQQQAVVHVKRHLQIKQNIVSVPTCPLPLRCIAWSS